MAWVSVFDIGQCTVAVSFSSSSQHQLFSQIMGKGQSAIVDEEGEWHGPYTVAVSDDGEVSLSGSQIGGSGGGLLVQVIPESLAADANCRVRGITIDVSQYGTTYASAIFDNPNDVYTELSGEGDSWSPDPCEKDGGVVELSIYGEGVGV